jgi:hypothetical protein
LCFSWSYLKNKKKNPSPSFTNKHINLTRGAKNEKEEENIRFSLGFILIFHCGFHQNNNIGLQQHWLTTTLAPRL